MTTTQKHTAGIVDDIKSFATSLLTGGGPGSSDYNARVQLISDAGGKALQNFAKSPEGKAVINKFSLEVALPAFVAGFALSWLLMKRKKGA
jgi:hypothetical protein